MFGIQLTNIQLKKIFNAATYLTYAVLKPIFLDLDLGL
jgi:hypothetical protein